MTAELQHGHPWPLGVHWDGHGLNIAVFSAHAQRIDFCIFDEAGQRGCFDIPAVAAADMAM